MRVGRRTSLRLVAFAVGRSLAARGIRAVLTGGACASLHSGGSYLSADLDFVLEGDVRLPQLDAAMADLGFQREANRYVHPESRFWVEFPRGPLAVGGDLDVEPVRLGGARDAVLALSATDSCRDRLAAFYHWSDRQSLEVALKIAVRNHVDLPTIRRWSKVEGHLGRFREFERQLRRRAVSRRGRSA